MKFSRMKFTMLFALLAMSLFSVSAFADTITLDTANQTGFQGQTFSFTGNFSGDITDALGINWISASPCADAGTGCIDTSNGFDILFPDTPGDIFDVIIAGNVAPGTYAGSVYLIDGSTGQTFGESVTDFSVTVNTPEPGSIALLGSGLLGLGGAFRRKLLA